MLLPFAENDPEALSNLTEFKQTLERLGLTDRGNVRIEYRWVPDVGRVGGAAAELIAMEPDVIDPTRTFPNRFNSREFVIAE